MSSFIAYMYLMKNTTVTIYFYRVGFTLTFLLGLFGNTASLLTFSRPTLRKVSTGCLFIALAISDLIYLSICIFDYLEFGWEVTFYGYVEYGELCRARSFLSNVTQFLSAWILVSISCDRWVRTRLPFQSTTFCTPRNALIVVTALTIISIGLNSHFLFPAYGTFIPGFANGACGPDFIDKSFWDFSFYQWSSIQMCISCLIPAFLMFIAVMDVSIVVRLKRENVIAPGRAWTTNVNRQKTVQKQFFRLILISILIFLITNLPVAVGKIIFPKTQDLRAVAVRVSAIWTGLGWFQSLNYAINFYIHCLSSNLFWNEFQQRIRSCRSSHHIKTEIHPITRS